MKITDTRVFPVNSKKGSNLVAFGSITFDDLFVVSGLKLVEGKNGLFLSMPASQDQDGEYHDIAFPLSKDFRDEMTEAMIEAYQDTLDEEPKKNNRRSGRK